MSPSASDNHSNHSNCSHVTVTSGLALFFMFDVHCVWLNGEKCASWEQNGFRMFLQQFEILLIIKFPLFFLASRTCWTRGRPKHRFKKDMDAAPVMSPKGFWGGAWKPGFWFTVLCHLCQSLEPEKFYLVKGGGGGARLGQTRTTNWMWQAETSVNQTLPRAYFSFKP